PPPVDLAAERNSGDLVRALIAEGIAVAVHDISDGGLLVAIAEMAMAAGIGAELDRVPLAAHAFWFGEDQARYVVTVAADVAETIMARARAARGPPPPGGPTGGAALARRGERPPPGGQLG